jgi:hypothetical protein
LRPRTSPVELEDGQQASWLSTREARWPSAEYHSRLRSAADIDDIFRNVMWETLENGMRRPGELVEDFAERAESEARPVNAHIASADTPTRVLLEHAGTDMTLECAASSRDEVTERLLNARRAPSTPIRSWPTAAGTWTNTASTPASRSRSPTTN